MFPVLLFALALAAAAPPASHRLLVTEEFFPENFVMYTGKHDIVEITVPLNSLNYPDSEEDSNDTSDQHLKYVFFVEADIKQDGTKDYKGVYVYKNGQAKKILDNGQTATYAEDYKVYIGATDGIYKYNYQDDSVEKFGSSTDNVIKMAVDTENAYIYYLTSDYVLYKFGKNEVASTRVEAVKDARDMIIDFNGNLFFYDGSKQLYVYNGNKVVKIEGLPAAPSKVALVNAAIFIDEVYTVVDGSLYEVTAKGTSEDQEVDFEVVPTAFAPDTIIIQYYAYKKKIYEYNVLSMTEKMSAGDLKNFFTQKEDEIKTYTRVKPSKKL